MNRIYRLIFSKKRGRLIPVAEITKSQRKGDTQGHAAGDAGLGPRRRGLVFPVGLALSLFLPGLAPWADAAAPLPTGGSVAVGSGSVSTSGTTMTVQQNTPKLGVNWQSFDIGAENKVVFKQPDAKSVALNRVVGTSRSEIYGNLEANGQVFLVNPNGVLFGKSAEVTVGGLMATTKNITDADFKAGNYRFSGDNASGEVINQGNLKATKGGFIVLAGNTVRNQGAISATGGNAVLAAGETVTLNLDTTGQLKVKVDGTTLTALIDNQGLIAADGGNVYLTARGKEMAQTSAINLQGVVRARSIGAKNGKVVIDGNSTGTVVATDAKIDVSGLNAGEKGGSVTLTGQKVGLLGTTTIDARGAAGGGTVLVGGDYQGKGDLAHAQKVVMGKKAKIDASATRKGQGGKVVLWSDAYTGFYGEIAAKGGILGGDGGLVETSSHDNLQAFGKVDASAPFGLAGTWLLDPTNVTIVAGAINTNDTDGGTGIWNPTATGAQIGVDNINAELNAGTSVTIHTSSGLAEAGNITVNAAIAKTGGANTSLTLNAAGSIVLNAGISSISGQLATTLNASGGSISGSGAINTNGGLLTLNSATSGTLSGIISGSGGLTKTGNGTQTLSGANTYTGATNLNGGTLKAGSSTALGNNSAVTMLANASVTLDLNGQSLSIGSLAQGGGVGRGIVTNTSATATPATLITGGNNSTTSFYGVIRDGGGLVPGVVSLVKQGSGTQTILDNTYTGTTTVAGGTLSLGAGSGYGLIAAASAVTVNSGATLTLNNSNTITFANSISGSGNLVKSGGGTTTLTGTASSFTGTTTINAGTLRFSKAAGLYGGDTSKWTASNIIVNSGGTLAANYGGTGEFTSAHLDTLKGLGDGTGGFKSGSFLGIDTSSGSQTYSSDIGNPNGGSNVLGLTKLGANTLTLTGTNTYTGTTKISGGTLQVGNGGTVGTLGSGAVTNSASLIFNRSDNITVAGAISGAGSLTKLGAGTLTLNGNNTYSGATTISGGTLMAGSNTALGTNSAVTLDNTAGVTLDLNGKVISIGSLAGGGTTGGTVTNSNATAATLTTGSNNTSTTFAGVIQDGAGTVALTKSGTGTQTLSGANTYTGATTVNTGGILQFAKKASLYGGDTSKWTTSNIIVNSGGTLAVNYGGTDEFASGDLDTLKGLGTGTGGFKSGSFLGIDTTSGDQAYNSAISDNGAITFGLTKLGANTLTLTGANTYTGGTNINAGTLSFANGSLGGAGLITMNGGTLQWNGGNTQDVSSRIKMVALKTAGFDTNGNNVTFASAIGNSTTASLTKLGGGILTLGGANTYTGATTISGGMLKAGSATALGANSAVTLDNTAGVTLDLNGQALTLGSLAGGGGTVTNSGADTTLTIGNNNTSTTFAGVIQDGAGKLSLAKIGTGNQTLTGANAYSGTTTVNSGILQFGKTASLYGGDTSKWTTNNIIVNSGATLGVNYGGAGEFSSTQLDFLRGLSTATGGFKNGSAQGIDTTSGSQTYSSAISDNGANTLGLAKLGANTLTLTGNNTYTGTTTVSGGTLQLGDGSNATPSIGSGNVVVTTNGTLAFNYNAPVTLANAMAGDKTSTFANIGTGRVTLSSNLSSTEALATIVNDTTKYATTVAGGAAGITFSSNTRKDVQGNVTLTSFNTAGNANTYIHSTAPGTVITIAGPVYAKWIGTSPSSHVYDTLANCLAWAPDVIINAGAFISTGFNDRSYYIRNLSGAGNMGIDGQYGSGMYLTGTSTLTGTITLTSKAFLNIGAGGSGGNAGSTNIVTSTYDNKVIFDSTTDNTYSGVISGPGMVTKNNTNTLIMTGNNTNSGGTLINAGTLQVGNGGATGTLGSGAVVDNANLVFKRSGNVNLSDLASSGWAPGITGTGNLTALIGGGLTVDRPINLSGASSNITLEAGVNVPAGDATGGDVTLSSAIATSGTGTITIFQGNPNTANLSSMLSGANGATKYKTYNVGHSAVSGQVAGTRNFYYRAAPMLTVSGVTASKTYDGGNSAMGYTSGGTVSGSVEGDAYGISDLTQTTATFNDKNAGSKTLNATYTANPLTSGGWVVSGYGVNPYSVNGAGTITPATLTITAATNRKTYDGTTGAAAGPTYSGLQAGDTLTGLTEAYDNKNAGTGKTLTVTGYTLSDGNNGQNYYVNLINDTTGVITPKDLFFDLQGQGNRVYDGTTVIGLNGVTPIVSGVIAGDDVAIDTGNVTGYVDKNAGVNKWVTYTGFAFTGGDMANYTLGNGTSASSTAIITPKQLTITAATNRKTYDGTTSAAATPTYSSLQIGDTLTGLTEVYDNKNAGTGKTLTVTGYSLGDGNNGQNYYVNLVNDTTGVIEKASITAVTGITANSKAYDATTAATLNTGSAGFTGMVNGDALGVATATGVFNTPFAGTGKRVRISGITLNGADAANYTLLDSTATTSADITGNASEAVLTAAVVANTSTEIVTASDNNRIDVTQSPESAALKKASLDLSLWKHRIIGDGILLPPGVKPVPHLIVIREQVNPLKI